MYTLAILNLISAVFMGLAVTVGYFHTTDRTRRDTIFFLIALGLFGLWSVFSLMVLFNVPYTP